MVWGKVSAMCRPPEADMRTPANWVIIPAMFIPAVAAAENDGPRPLTVPETTIPLVPLRATEANLVTWVAAVRTVDAEKETAAISVTRVLIVIAVVAARRT